MFGPDIDLFSGTEHPHSLLFPYYNNLGDNNAKTN